MSSIVEWGIKAVQAIDVFTEMAWLLNEADSLIVPTNPESIYSTLNEIAPQKFKSKGDNIKSASENYNDDLFYPSRKLIEGVSKVIKSDIDDDFEGLDADIFNQFEKIIYELEKYIGLVERYINDAGVTDLYTIHEVIEHDLLTRNQINLYISLEENYNHFVRHTRRFIWMMEIISHGNVKMNANIQLMKKIIIGG